MIDLFRSTTFRLALIYLGLFGVSVMAVLGFVYYQTVIYADQQTDETIDAEITGLAEQWRQRGLAGLVAVIAERSGTERGSNMLYLLTDSHQRPLAGNLDHWPDATIGPDGWMRFPLQPIGGQPNRGHIARATSFLLAGGYQLLVGRDLWERSQFRQRMVTALGWSVGLTLLLGLTGGLIMSRRLLARLEAINRASDQVTAGELGRRIPVRGSGDEFDRLAQTLNSMLDRIEHLMAGIRQVSDNIAHDLRSPLGRLRSRLEMAMRTPDRLPAPYRDVLQESIADADQLLATFNALLDIAEAEAGSLRAEMAPLDLGDLLHGLVDLYEPVADEKQISLSIATLNGPFPVRGNRHLLSRAMANLIENALKYTPAPGRITVTLGASRGGFSVTIADSGPGIPESARQIVFDRFVRLEHSRTSPGNGLGLSLARAVIQLHGGTILLEDNEPGLRVVVSLPAAEPQSPPLLEEHGMGQPRGMNLTAALDSASRRQ